MASFGQQLRSYRRQSRDPDRDGLLTQERFGELIGSKLGDAGYSGAAVSDWERDKSKIHADDRVVLVALLAVLRGCGGLSQIAEADGLLTAGNYRRLDREESAEVFPGETFRGQQPAAATTAMPNQPASEAAGRQPPARDRTQRILLDKVESFWVDGVLKKATEVRHFSLEPKLWSKRRSITRGKNHLDPH